MGFCVTMKMNIQWTKIAYKVIMTDVHQILGHFHYAGTTLIVGLEKLTAKYAYKMVYCRPHLSFWMVNTN